MAAEVLPLLITGGTGKLGRILRDTLPWAMRAGLRPVWQARREVPGCTLWRIGAEACPPGLASGVVLALAGGRKAIGEEPALVAATMAAARSQGARHVFFVSSATVYRPGDGLSEDTPPDPQSDYGRSKLDMERSVEGMAGVTVLRIGNVVGADALLAGTAGDVVLDPAPGGRGPVRSYIGPRSLSGVLARLAVMAAEGTALPALLNIAAPRPVAMADLLDAAGRVWRFGPDHPGIVPRVVFDTARLGSILRLPPQASQPAAMVAEWRQLQA